MRTLLLLRHGKSASDDPTLADFERPLTPDGELAAQTIGEYLRDTVGAPDHVICSAAVRACQTWEHMAGCFDPAVSMTKSRDLYLATAETIFETLRQAPNEAERVLIIGHNPGMHQLGVQLARAGNAKLRSRMAEKFPTCACAEITLGTDDWESAPNAGELIRFVTPREFRESA